ncbi:MAG: hypothetical protein ACRD4R_08640 [Candidatus Acidiferrales bacterium]
MPLRKLETSEELEANRQKAAAKLERLGKQRPNNGYAPQNDGTSTWLAETLAIMDTKEKKRISTQQNSDERLRAARARAAAKFGKLGRG